MTETSIRFLLDEELDKLAEVQLLRDYIRARQQEIELYNEKYEVNASVIINGHRQTNAGVFRAYVIASLKQNPKLHKKHDLPGPATGTRPKRTTSPNLCVQQ